MYTMHNPVFFNDPSGLYAVPVAIPAAAAPVILIVGGVAIVVTGAYLLTPSGQQLLAEASWALVDGVELVGSALSYFSAMVGSFAGQAASSVADTTRDINRTLRGNIRGRTSATAEQSSPANPGPEDPRNWQRVDDGRLRRALQEQSTSPHELKYDYLGKKHVFPNTIFLLIKIRDSLLYLNRKRVAWQK